MYIPEKFIYDEHKSYSQCSWRLKFEHISRETCSQSQLLNIRASQSLFAAISDRSIAAPAISKVDLGGHGARGNNVWTPLQDLPQGWRSIACLQIVCIYCPCLVWCSWQHVVAAVHPSVVSPVSGISLLRSVLCWSGAPLCTDGARGRQHRGRATHAGDPNREAAPHLAEPTRAGWWVWKFGKSSVKKIRAI